MNINKLLDNVLEHEGGFVDHPNDKGGPTNYGITLAALNEYTGLRNSKLDIKMLSEHTARAIYQENYYRKPGINRLPEAMQPLLFDMAVNHGCKTGVQLLQSQLLADGYECGLVDGYIGRSTIAAAIKALADLGQVFINNLVNRRIARYRSIIKHDPTQAVFEKGWIARAETFRPEAIA